MTRWRGCLALALSVVFPANSMAQPDLTITVHVVRRVPVESVLAERCGPRPVRACTRFIGRELTGECALAARVWKAQPKARMGILTFIPRNGSLMEDASLLSHERKHVADVERDVRGYLQRLRERSFDSLTDCRDALTEAARRFPSEMDSMQLASNVHRDRAGPRPATRTAKARD